MIIVMKVNNKGKLKYYIAHNHWNAVLGEYFDDLDSAQKRLIQLEKENEQTNKR